jgi:predicted HAD superfamily Cof-like phosphohydrolase
MKERIDFLVEELTELQNGAEHHLIAEVADALVDLVYVAKGTAVMMGLPWQELWDDVHRANTAKERGIGKRGHKIDLIKPAGWHPPQTLKVLSKAGYTLGRNPYDYPSEGTS